MIRIQIPATSANLGSGFDSLGIALTMYNQVWTSVLSSHSLRRFSSALRQNLSTIPASRLKRAINSSKVFCSITITFSIRLPFNCDYAAK